MQIRFKISLVLLFLNFPAMQSVGFAADVQPIRPNIVTVLIDDMGYSDLSSFGGEVKTTNIDRLADEGIRFTNFYVNSPICSPSRTALTTGQYPQRWRITSFLNNRQSNQRRGLAQWLDPAAPILARQLHDAGYFTGHFGKWHMGGQRDVGDAPLITEYGFDHSLTNFEGLGPRVLGFKDSYDGSKPELHDLGSNKLGRGPIETMDRSRITGRYVERAVQHIDQAVAQGQPFFVNVWPDDVHSPFFPPEVLRDKTDKSKRQLYLAVLKAMDNQLGELIDRIRGDAKLRDNTLIVVFSDNGHEPSAGRSEPLRGHKGLLYEGGIRSPLIVWGPGFIQPSVVGSTNDQSVFSAIDINRSYYEFTNTPVPPGAMLDGEVVLDTMLGKSQAGRKSPIFFRRPPDRPDDESAPKTLGKRSRTKPNPPADAPDLAVRDGKWKFLINLDKSDPQLYDLSKDTRESRNVVGQHSEVAKRLEKAVLDWNAALPKDAGDPTFSETDSTSQNKSVNPSGEKTPVSTLARQSPNVVVILADDLGWNSVGYHNDEFKTPHIDSIAGDGIRLNRFYVAPMCSPTRAGLMTGRYPIRFGLARAVIPPYRDFGLPTSETTLPEMLGNSGYEHRGIFGKWHLGHRRSKWHPLAQGFSHFHGHYNGAIDYFELTRDDARDWQDDYEASGEQGYSTDLIASAAANWIKESTLLAHRHRF